MTKRRTKKQYTDLHDNPESLFGAGVQTILWPSGVPEIWFKDKEGRGFKVCVSSGPAGFSIRMSPFIGSPALTVSGNKTGDWAGFSGPDLVEATLTQYKADEKSQAFKAWYQSDASERDDKGLAILNDDAVPLGDK
jgi:hypothetical protein